ncbi:MAG: polyphosphate kinase 2 family protein [Propionibacteriales bacterium]|nr:polyphosphate kinase 2 family protein [Propionibacteriales bacterium]
MAKNKKAANLSLSDQLRVPRGRTKVDLATLDPRATTGYPGAGKKDAEERTLDLQPELSDLQERLYAAGRSGDAGGRRVLVILQGMDTAGKGGVIRHAIGMVDPQGVQLTAFKAPTAAEKRHDYLWRIRRSVPDQGMIGIFDRSQYEDVLTVRVNKMVPATQWRKRFAEINAFEAELADQGTTIIKCFLNVSRDKQKERLAERLANPDKYWKYNPGDVDERAKWDDYQAAYADVLTRCNTSIAPWYVIPSDRKWYRNWAVAQLLTEHLRALDLGWPEADFDVDVEKERLAEA